jgi:hypothetical protein
MNPIKRETISLLTRLGIDSLRVTVINPVRTYGREHETGDDAANGD